MAPFADAGSEPVGTADGLPGSMRFVPAEVANQRLWAVTTEYENLLRLQKEHQLLTAQRRKAEVNHLRSIAEMLAGEGADEEVIRTRMQARDQEVAANQKSQQALLELLGAVLVLRDRQIDELQHMCEAKRSQIQQSQKSKSLPEQPGRSWSDVENLQAECLSMDSAVAEKREELRSLAGTLDAKTQRVAELHAEVAQAEKEVGNLAGAPAPVAHAGVVHQGSPGMISRQQHCKGLAEIEPAAASSSLAAKVQAMQQQLANAKMAMGDMVRSHQQNDQLVRGTANVSDPGILLEEENSSVGFSLMSSAAERSDPVNLARPVLEHIDVLSAPSSLTSPQGGAPQSSLEEFQAHVTAIGGPSSSSSPHEATNRYLNLMDMAAASAAVGQHDVLSGRRTPSPRSQHSIVDEPWHLYRSHSDDQVDAMVAQFVNQPRNRLRRALFSRTAEGQYLYGTQKANLRLNPDTGALEAKGAVELDAHEDQRNVTGWMPVVEFTRRLERAQSSSLQRARDRGRWPTNTGYRT